MKRIRWVCVCGCLLLSLSACSKKQEVPKEVKACDVIPQPDVQAVFGGAAKVDTTGGTANKCCADVPGMKLCATIARGIAGLSARDKYNVYVAELTGKYPGQQILPEGVADLGDTSGWLANVGELFVFKGNVLLSLTANPPEKATLAQMKALAEKAVPRLPQ
ncbi:hypothetical protein U14_05828 [Candidatus Moduliflexus flocculans]|uniref:Uncharacterized protein n=1 Tax=Candidatus Moduliflexus flocculans TaxID=1499966 RepID=A0A081BT10_9BACT|nr:hypothetical protein U14_05828 [Candidatus Moduliflexus flocculans]